MADLLATPQDLATLLGVPIDLPRMTLILEACTAVVQAAAGGQRIVATTSTVDMVGTVESWISLPQQPVNAIMSVEFDGELLAASDYRRHGARLWRPCGWQTYLYEPSRVVVDYSHGYSPIAQEIQLARSATLMLARQVLANPTGLRSESIGDYAYAYEKAAEQMEASPNLKAALRRQYGVRAGLARIGGS